VTARAKAKEKVAPWTDSEPKGDTPSRYEIAVVADSLRLLRHISSIGAISTRDAADFLEVSRSTAYRILLTLAAQDFVNRSDVAGLWTAGYQAREVVEGLIDHSLRSIAAPSMERLLAEMNETLSLAVYTGREVKFVRVMESPLPLRMSNSRGENAPLHASSLGKAILAAHSPEERARIVNSLVLTPITERTITNPVALLEDLDLTCERGWAEDRSEATSGVTCFGAALLGPGDVPVGALSMSVPEVRLPPGRAAVIGRRLVEEAQRVSQELRSGPGLRWRADHVIQ
jgi:DNA-binding IclR family transcriptional regulator